jgi:diguanylate cyclase (GGDEF)-like protein
MKVSFRDLPIGYRLSLGISAIIALMIGVTALSITGSKQPRAQLSKLIADSNSMLATVAQMRQDLLLSEVLARRLSIANTFDDAQAIMRELQATQVVYEQHLEQFAAPSEADAQGTLLEELRRHLQISKAGTRSAANIVNAFNPVRAADVLSRDVSPLHIESLRILDRLIQAHSREIQARVEALDRAAAHTDLATIGVCVLAVVAATLIAARLTRSITLPLRNAVAYADSLGNGQLDAPRPHCQHDEAGALIDMMANMAARLAEMHHHLEQQSSEDALTGAYNRRHFDQVMQLEHGRALRLCGDAGQLPDGAHLALLMLDVDHFKRYNDRFGHPAGDACLQKVVAAVQRACHRPTDVLARYGGEEFAVILPGCDPAGAAHVAERVRQAVLDAKIESGDPESPCVTVSVGVAVCASPREFSVADLISATDEQLYRSKHEGRNRVSCCRLPPDHAIEQSSGEPAVSA